MNTEHMSFSLANIVMLYEDLSVAKVSRDKILDIFEGLQPQHLDVNPVFFVRYPTKRIEIYIFINDNRVETKIANPYDDSWNDLIDAGSAVYNAIQGSSLKAFGFNLFTEISGIEESATKFLVRQFEKSLSSVEAQIGGKVESLATTLKYIKNKENHQLDILPSVREGSTLDVRLNVQYDKPKLLNRDDLLKNYLDFKEDTIATMGKLFS